MSEALQVAASVSFVVGIAAAFLWLVEAIAKLIGGKNTWLLFLVVIPFIFGLAISVFNWEKIAWWERIAYPVLGPITVAALLWVGFAAINPADALLVLCTLVRSGWRIAIQRIRGS